MSMTIDNLLRDPEQCHFAGCNNSDAMKEAADQIVALQARVAELEAMLPEIVKMNDPRADDATSLHIGSDVDEMRWNRIKQELAKLQECQDRIAELEAEAACSEEELFGYETDLSNIAKERDALAAQAEEMRGALSAMLKFKMFGRHGGPLVSLIPQYEDGTTGVNINRSIVKRAADALVSTPTTSLAKVRNEVLEEAYNALFVVPAASMEQEQMAQRCQAAIRNLKEGE
jgi:small-conductance mechanosensitive channel